MNKAILMGNVGRDPHMKMVGTTPVAEFSLATSERSQSGVEKTEWHNIVMWGPAAEFAEKYIRKGTRLLVEGKIRTRRWEDATAISRNITEIYVDSFELLPGRNG
ncbi:MAG: single-stranded DNA-binding protein [Muribaculaceae bacterium]|nr:single-stranded DNA-binding protein [Muribaculaceae bacterium]